MTSFLLAALLSTNAANAQNYWDRDEAIDQSVAAQLTPAGLDSLGGVAGAVIPGDIPIDDISDGADNGFCLIDYFYSVENMWVGLEVDQLKLVPGNDVLNLDLTLNLWMNEAADPFNVAFSAVCLDSECEGYVDPFPVNVKAPISMAVTDPLDPDLPIDVTVADLEINFPPSLGSYIQMQSGCGSDVEQFLNDYLGISLYGLITDLILPFVEDLAGEFTGEIETQLEDALVATVFEDTIDLLGVPMDVRIYPDATNITPAGLEIVMGSSFSAPPSPCVEVYGSPGSLKTDTPIPAIGSLPAGSELVLQVSDDMANNALWTIWDAGVLCFTLPDPTGESSFGDLPIPLNTSLLGLVGGGDGFSELFPETQPIVIETAPNTPLMVDYQSDHDVEVDVRDLDLNFYAELDYRQARALGVTIDGDVGADLDFDGSTGQLDVNLDLAGDALRVSAANNELVPEASTDIETSFRGLIDTIIDSVAADAIDGLSFTLPSADGVGLESLTFSTSGSQNDWLTGSATVGEVSYGAGSGCDCSGDSGTGCSGGGCSAGGVPVGLLAFAVPLIMLRRRR